MTGLIDAAAAVMRASSSRIDNAAINVANVSTPGFKRRIRDASRTEAPFDTVMDTIRVDGDAGKLTQTGRSLDIAIAEDGYFQLRAGDRMVYSRGGGFVLDGEGRVVTQQGYALQQAGGGDLMLTSATVVLGADGTLLDGERPLGRVAVFRPRAARDATALDGSLFAIADADLAPVDTPSLRQGMLEASNVSMADEMTETMAALRGAETGARLVQVYDDLLGKAISTFGQAAR